MPARAPNARTRASPSSWPLRRGSSAGHALCSPDGLRAGPPLLPDAQPRSRRRPRGAAARGVRAPARRRGRSPADHRGRERSLPRPLRPPRDDANTYTQTYDRPELDTDLWVVAWAGDEIAGVVQNWIWPEENERLGVSAAGSSTSASAGRGAGAAWPGPSPRRHCIAFPGRRSRGRDAGRRSENPNGALGLYEGLGFEKASSATPTGATSRADGPPARLTMALVVDRGRIAVEDATMRSYLSWQRDPGG